MKILLVGASSDIANELFVKYKSEYNFIRLSSNSEFSDVENFNIQDPNTYIDEENIDGLVYFPGTIVLKPFQQLSLDTFENDYNINVLGLIKVLKFYQTKLSDSASLVFISTVAANIGMPFHSSISMCKASLEEAAKSLAAGGLPSLELIV